MSPHAEDHDIANLRLMLDEVKGDGFDWRFMCHGCVRAWRKRGLERVGVSDEAEMVQLDKEYPLGHGGDAEMAN